MKPELYKYTGAILLVLVLFLLTGATCDLSPKCNNGPSGALRTLSGADAEIVRYGAADNSSYRLTMKTPDPYLRWRSGSSFGNHSINCFCDYWDATYGDDAQQAVIWIGSDVPLGATISSVKYSEGVITANLRRPYPTDPGLAGSGEVVIEINRAYNSGLTCFGIQDFTNCYQPFFSPENSTFTASAPGATLNFATFDGAWMPDSNLSGTVLSNASFTGANLLNTNFDNALIQYTDFTNSDMTGSHGYGARVYEAISPNGTVVNSFSSLLKNKVGYSATTITTP